MATVTTNLGIVTAYGYAVSAGYTGTEDDFAQLMLGSKKYYELITEAYNDMASEDNYILARSYAVGDTETRDGEESDNAKYYAQLAQSTAESITSGVASYNGRTGTVTPASGDYSADMVTYDNSLSGLEVEDVQAAIDEVASMAIPTSELQQELDDLSEDIFKYYYGLLAQTTVFNSDGTITATNDEATVLTEFDGDTITETVTPTSDTDTHIYIKTTVFDGDTITESYTTAAKSE